MHKIAIDPKNKGKSSSFYEQREKEIGMTIDQHRLELTDRVIGNRYLWGEAIDFLISDGLLVWKRDFPKLPLMTKYGKEKVAIHLANLEDKYSIMIHNGDGKARRLEDVLSKIYAARNDLVELNVPLLIKQMHDRGCTRYNDDVFQEIFQFTVMGLMRAAHSYDYKFGLRFTTYAYQWVQSHITEALKNLGLINGKKRNGVTIVSIDNGDDESDSLKSRLADPTSLGFEDEFIGVDLIDKVLNALPKRHANMIEMRLNDMTLEAISKIYHISKERVRQILKNEILEHVENSNSLALRETFRNMH